MKRKKIKNILFQKEMSDMSNQPLSQLALSLMDADAAAEHTMPAMPVYATHAVPVAAPVVHTHVHEHDHKNCGHGFWSFLFLWLVIAVVLYFLFFALRPSFVLKRHCGSSSSDSNEDWDRREIDQGRLLGSAILISLVLILLVWLFSYAFYQY